MLRPYSRKEEPKGWNRAGARPQHQDVTKY